jgi:predicted TIM-barrel fold metal-dependent hydrolase
MRRRSLVATLLLAQACSHVSIAPRNVRPIADHHQHLFSPRVAAMLRSEGHDFGGINANQLVSLLDEAGIRRAAVLSAAYMYGSPSRTVADELAKVRAENDWTAEQVAQYPDRLMGFCEMD